MRTAAVAAITMIDDHDHDGGDGHKSNAQGGGSFLDAIKVRLLVVL